MFWKIEDLMDEDTAASDTEILQTDIQRFVAILGFCLMAIFALVQSISVTSARERTEIEDLDQRMETQQREVERLAQENHRLRNRIDDLTPYVGKSEDISRELIAAQTAIRRQELEIRELLSGKPEQEKGLLKLKLALGERDAKIRRLVQEKVETENRLAEIQARLQNDRRLAAEIERLKKLLARSTATGRELDKTRQEKERLERLLQAAMRVQPPARPKKTQEATPAAKSLPPRKGRYVAFESDRVFMSLLAAERISLYIKVAGLEKWFRAHHANPGVTFSAAVPEAILDPWEVGEDLVPDDIIAAFREWTSLSSRTEMLVVGLPPDISGAIRGRGNTHGRFIIESGGNVTFNSFEE